MGSVTLFGCVMIAFPLHEYDLGENWSCKFLVGLLICFGACWPPGFTRHFLRTSSCSVTLLTLSSKLSKWQLFSLSFFYCASGIIFVITKWLHLGFDNASNFALYSKTFPLFTRMTPSIVFFNGMYSLKVSWFPSSSIVFSQPFFLCSFNLILEFFLQLQYTHMNSFLYSWLF